MAYEDQMKETMELKITKARNAHSKALKEASEFEFVAGGVNDVDQNRLTGAQIDLGEIPIAALRGIHMYPLMDCNDIHQDCSIFTTEMLENAFLMLQNAGGLTENPQFRGVPVHNRFYRNYKTESKAEMFVRFFKVMTPANNLLPELFQELKSQIEQTASSNAKRAAAKAAAEEETNACSLSNDTSKVKISSKKRKSVLEFKAMCPPPSKEEEKT